MISKKNNIFTKYKQISETYPKMSFQLLLSAENGRFYESVFFSEKKQITDSAEMFGFPKNGDLSLMFGQMNKAIKELKKQLDRS